MAKSRNYVEVFKGRPDESGQAWRWRVKSGNGKKVGTAGEAFYNFWTAKRSALRRAVLRAQARAISGGVDRLSGPLSIPTAPSRSRLGFGLLSRDREGAVVSS